LITGWKDDVEYLLIECEECGLIEDWTYWDEVGKARYIGDVGKLVGQDASKPPHCPHCGSTKGHIVEDDDETWED